jgi:hypothetical protein
VQNAQGWSQFSNVTTILTATLPAKPATPVVSSEDTQVKITISKPDERGSPLLAYEIRLFDFEGGDHELPELCPGDDPVKISSVEYSCVFDML